MIDYGEITLISAGELMNELGRTKKTKWGQMILPSLMDTHTHLHNYAMELVLSDFETNICGNHT